MRLLISIIAFALLGSCQSAPETEVTTAQKKDTMATPVNTTAPDNVLTSQEQNEGWQLLFDGNDKNNWHVYNAASDGSAWRVVDGTLFFDPAQKLDSGTRGGGDIVTNEEYGNFHLKLEWKVDTGGNSGIMFYVKEDKKYERAWHTGPEMQVLDNARHKDASITKHRAGDLYDLISSSPETVKPANEWNQVEIISNKGALEFHLNGSKVLSATLWDDNWKKLVAGSKFKIRPDFGTFKTGRIALQDHGDKVWYRNIKIKKL